MSAMLVLPKYVHSPNDYTLRGVNLVEHGFDFLPEVCQLSYRFMNDVNPEHVHRGRIEVIYLHSGHGMKLSVGGQLTSFNAGNCFISRPDEPHTISIYPKGSKFYWFQFRIPKARETVPGLTLAETRQLTDALMNAKARIFAGSPSLRDTFERILALTEPDAVPPPLIDVRLRTAALDLLMETIASLGRAPIRPRKSVADQLASEMSAHPERDFPLRRIAAEAGISVSGLSARFKASTGTTPHAYLTDCRIRRAKELLASGKRSAADIASSLGFASYTHFSALFHAHTGISPADFRAGPRR